MLSPKDARNLLISNKAHSHALPQVAASYFHDRVITMIKESASLSKRDLDYNDYEEIVDSHICPVVSDIEVYINSFSSVDLAKFGDRYEVVLENLIGFVLQFFESLTHPVQRLMFIGVMQHTFSRVDGWANRLNIDRFKGAEENFSKALYANLPLEETEGYDNSDTY